MMPKPIITIMSSLGITVNRPSPYLCLTHNCFLVIYFMLTGNAREIMKANSSILVAMGVGLICFLFNPDS